MNQEATNVAKYLIEKGFLLTALEFHTELLESGDSVEVLKKQFETEQDIIKRYEQLKPDAAGTIGGNNLITV